MKLNIELKDNKYCNGCPCFSYNYIEDDSLPFQWICLFYKRKIDDSYGSSALIERLKDCIKAGEK